MQTTQKNFLKFIDFKDLHSWSAYSLLGKDVLYTQEYTFAKIGTFLERKKEQVFIQDKMLYKRPTIRTNGQGIRLRDEVYGEEIGTKKQFRIYEGQFLVSKIDARNGAFGVVPKELDKGIITGNFWTFDVYYSKINPQYLALLTGTKEFSRLSQTASVGTTNRNYLQENIFLNFKIPLPPLSLQQKIVSSYFEKIQKAEELEKENKEIRENLERVLFEDVKEEKKQETDLLLRFVEFANMSNWDVKFYTTQTTKFNINIPLVLFNTFLRKAIIQTIQIEDEKEYSILGVRAYGMGAYINRTIEGKFLKMKKYQQAKENHLFWCKVDTKNGAFGVVHKNLSHAVASTNMTFAEIDTNKVSVDFLQLLFSIKGIMQYLDSFVTGTTNRKYIKPSQLLNEIKIPLPPLSEQKHLIGNYYENIKEIEKLKLQAESEFEKAVFL